MHGTMILKFRFYFTENTLRLHYEDQSGTAVWGNNVCRENCVKRVINTLCKQKHVLILMFC